MLTYDTKAKVAETKAREAAMWVTFQVMETTVFITENAVPKFRGTVLFVSSQAITLTNKNGSILTLTLGRALVVDYMPPANQAYVHIMHGTL